MIDFDFPADYPLTLRQQRRIQNAFNRAGLECTRVSITYDRGQYEVVCDGLTRTKASWIVAAISGRITDGVPSDRAYRALPGHWLRVYAEDSRIIAHAKQNLVHIR